MNIQAPLPLNPSPNIAQPDSGLRLFQRVTAEILQINGTQAVISIDGHPIVARLVSQQEAAQLAGKKVAQFIVTAMDQEAITLKIFNPPQPSAAGSGVGLPVQEMALRILQEYGLPVRPELLLLARAALAQHLEISPENLQKMLAALGGGSWGQAEAEMAAAMLAAGLPLNEETLAVALRARSIYPQGLVNLIGGLQSAQANPSLTAEQTKLLQTLQNLFQHLLLPAGADAQTLASRIREAVRFGGRTLENILLRAGEGIEGQPGQSHWMEAVRLITALRQNGLGEVAEQVQRFLDQARMSGLLNLPPQPVPGEGAWAEARMLLARPVSGDERGFLPVRLRVARREKGGAARIDPLHTTLNIQVEVQPDRVFQVALSVVGRQMRVVVTAPDVQWLSETRSEMPSLEEALQDLGYNLQDSRVEVGQVDWMPSALSPAPARPSLAWVDLEV
ncbi:hypothetical protein BECAL_03165 [Bellilinea caldifistulae]|uniref:Uncharacterized protein n=1 Tax=Bellilinea caldifistulae TaxID=360411 RepID=A0A0P6X1K2_9CHLR|nr:hypothetical protein [Bellilinea caldifistulae]KPL76296.1 hypothetical protein AC812_06375 [Bellilinea caldifistulae]GAP11966.1 hypothetical protein BECAL_03165 [Bellilinea caldifistulae]